MVQINNKYYFLDYIVQGHKDVNHDNDWTEIKKVIGLIHDVKKKVPKSKYIRDHNPKFR